MYVWFLRNTWGSIPRPAVKRFVLNHSTIVHLFSSSRKLRYPKFCPSRTSIKSYHRAKEKRNRRLASHLLCTSCGFVSPQGGDDNQPLRDPYSTSLFVVLYRSAPKKFQQDSGLSILTILSLVNSFSLSSFFPPTVPRVSSLFSP